MKLIFETEDFMLASLLEELFKHEEMPYIKTGDHLNGLLGGLPLSETYIQFFVPIAEEERAGEILETFTA